MSRKRLIFFIFLFLVSYCRLLKANFFEHQGETCPAESIHVNISEATANKEAICTEMEDSNISRLGDLAAIYGDAYGCAIKVNQPQTLSKSLCKTVSRIKGSSCPVGTEHVTFEEASDASRGDSDNLCSMLDDKESTRLAAQAAIERFSDSSCDSVGYDLQPLESSLCKTKLDASGGVDSGLDGSNQKKIAYVEVNSNDIANVGCFKENDELLFDIAIIFAANINYDSNSQKAVLHLNRRISNLLDNNLQKIRHLQKEGVKVLLSVLGNHQNAGWSCFANEEDAIDFAQIVKSTIDRYGLDGIDIDDEYSRCDSVYSDSLPLVTKALRDKMPDKLITKALFRDTPNFKADWNGHNLSEKIDYGWEMSYWSKYCTSRLHPYAIHGVSKSKLSIGASTVSTPSATAKNLAQCAIDKNYEGGMMIFNVTANSLGYLRSIWQGVSAIPNCLK
ncbi:glycosyl hydrolase family 18 protein [Endozoicomonas sp. Mp262]|uniref:glycosyl hydrolase family 18 protein n=1 Tax=Endozoicomonas sp. Mp262 TaxID=2919499 RepID=UPI0021DA4393